MEELSEIQIVISNVTEDNISIIADKVKSVTYFKNEIDGEDLLIENFISLVPIRFKNLNVIAKLFVILCDYYSGLKTKFIDYVFNVGNDDGLFLSKLNPSFFLHYCLLNKLYTIGDIIQKLKDIPQNMNQNIAFISFFFIDDISKSDNDFFNYLCDVRKKAQEGYFFGPYMRDIPSFEQMKNNNFEDLHLLLKHGTLDPLLICIRNDDLDKFVEFSAQSNFDRDRIVSTSCFDPIYYPSSKMSLIEFAIISNAVSIFKTMFLSKFPLTENIFQFAVCSCNYEIIRILDNEGAITKKCLAAAAVYRPVEIFDWLLSQFYPSLTDGNQKNLSRETAEELSFLFGEAIKMNNFSCITFCIHHFPDVINCTCNSENEHPLFIALNSPFILRYLLSQPSINVNPVSFSSTPFLRAVQLGKLEQVKIFLGTDGVDLLYEDGSGMNALMFAANDGYLSILKLLVETNKYDINHFSTYHETALFVACRENRVDVVQYLISLPNIDAEIKSNQDNTCLHIACMRNLFDIVKLLVESGKVNVNEPGFHGLKPFEMATDNNIKALLSK